MNILLVHQVMGTSVRPIVPLGLISMATFVEHSSPHEVRVFDPNVEDDWHSALRTTVNEFQPDLIGVSFRNIDSTLYLDRANYFPGLKRLLRDLKAMRPEVPLVVGGAGVAVFGEQLMQRIPEVDACVAGPGEEALLRMADAPGKWDGVPGCMYRSEGRIVHARTHRTLPFTDFPFPRRDFVHMERYRNHSNAVGVLTKQGCARQCIYCMYPLTSGRKVDVRSPVQVCDELEYLERDFGVQHVYIADNQFNEPVGSMTALCEEMIRRKTRVKWTAFFNCFRRNLNKDLLSLVKRAGCICVQATPEGYPQRYLDVFGKYREADVLAFIDLFRNEHEVEALIDFFVDAPGQRLDDFFKMLVFVTKQVAQATLRRVPVTFKLHAIRIYPDTPIFQKAIDAGFLKKDTDLLTESETLDEALYYLTPLRKAVYAFLLMASKLVGYRTPDYRLR